MVDLEELLESPAYESRGIRALGQKDWARAAALFRKGLALAPESPALRHRLGTALFMMEDVRGAREQFEEVVRTSRYSWLVVSASSSRTRAATQKRSSDSRQHFGPGRAITRRD
jgi:hypothetical protein